MPGFKIWIRILLSYFILIIISGISLEAFLVFPASSGNYYHIAKFIHKTVVYYGLLMNFLIAVILLPVKKDHENSVDQIIYWFFQGGLILSLAGVMAGNSRFLSYMDIQTFLLYVVVFVILYFLYCTRNYYQDHNFKNHVWMYFIQIPLTGFVFFLVIISANKLFQTWSANILEIGFYYYVYSYLLMVITTGILLLSFIPDLGSFKTGLFSEAEDSDYKNFFRIVKLQWYAQTFFFSVFLFFQIKYFTSRDSQMLFDKMFTLVLYLSFIISSMTIYYAGQQFLRDKHQQSVINISLMFFSVFLVIELMLVFLSLNSIFEFTSLQTAQKHLLITGYILPAFYIFYQLQVAKSDIPNGKLNMKIIIVLWWVATLSLASLGWITGGMEAALWHKMNVFGFFEYPGWGSIVDKLRPFHLAGFVFFTIFFCISVIVLIINRNSRKIS